MFAKRERESVKKAEEGDKIRRWVMYDALRAALFRVRGLISSSPLGPHRVSTFLFYFSNGIRVTTSLVASSRDSASPSDRF